ncbi:MAG TPA: rubrerythrin family protein [Spirochaetota bacterium]|nr:rubrerythrin family protein [Spirochaetota bacterium]HOS33022.1 rubrerythrin family protein [Spirochaetota bacterium]HOS55963.1 rubrerythrin family protein [Spirochaetota bacterium]HPK61538.1 rubrerythrin family protein [Spirochaetota bacterium]HQF78446.1 rubrerythrin family protein [Spirochaetota bacterium]
MKTVENLLAAFAGESQANRRYLAFAKKADEDGYPQIAKLFRAVAEAETVHAHAHLKAADEIKSTEENLKTAIEGEAYEFNDMYPDFLKVAEEEDHKRAITSFKFALAVEKIHYDLYKKALESFKGGKDLPKAEIHICPICGDTFVGEHPDKCPVCSAPASKFVKIS